VDRLGESIQGRLDWRQQVGRHPYASIAIAAASGLFLSAIFRRRRSPAERIMDAVAELVEDAADQARDRIAGALGGGSARQFLRGTVAALATKAAVGLVSSSRARRADKHRTIEVGAGCVR